MTVKELIEKLREFPEEATVWADGCDCTNRVINVEIEEEEFVTLKVAV